MHIQAPAEESILRGKYAGPGVGSLLFGGIGLLCAAAAVKFWFFDDARDVAPYPALSALVLLLFPLLAWLLAGRFEVTLHGISGKRRVSKPWELPWDRVAGLSLHQQPGTRPDGLAAAASLPGVELPPPRFDRLELLGPDGKKLLSLPDPRPIGAPGLVWLLLQLRGRAPDEVLLGLGQDTRGLRLAPEIHADVERQILEGDKPAFHDRGLVISLADDLHVYQPLTTTGKIPGLGSVLVDLVSPISFHTTLKFGDAPPPGALPLVAFAQAAVQSRLPGEQKAARLGALAGELGGMVFRDRIDEHGCLRGEIGGRQARVQARKPAGPPCPARGARC
ncbi:MAG TPA: hypothetical protein PK668_09415 [Myxococcota bacterium]|nr:hypothetical protein [Myxococcota bacterium]HRY92800.1 hypothetical protein [Myxococcota bacterium]HSA19824.1 hypothetical protein [Myxococcota bacterium]